MPSVLGKPQGSFFFVVRAKPSQKQRLVFEPSLPKAAPVCAKPSVLTNPKGSALFFAVRAKQSQRQRLVFEPSALSNPKSNALFFLTRLRLAIPKAAPLR